MSVARHVRLFRNGRNQAIRIPREYELPGNEAMIHREGRLLIIEAVEHPSLLAFLASAAPVLEDDFPNIDNLSPLDDVVF